MRQEDKRPLYTCVNCGRKLEELYKKYSPTVLKLSSCRHCHQIADKYIEYDRVIVMIDLVLLKKEAYRHIIYNTTFQLYWKLAVTLFLMEAYSEWSLKSPQYQQLPESSTNGTQEVKKNNDLLLDYKELRFYIILLKVMFCALCFFTALYVTTLFFNKIFPSKIYKLSFGELFKALTLASFGKFLLLPALIWGDKSLAELHLIFVFAYTTLSQLLVYTVICSCSRLLAIIVILPANAVKLFLGENLDSTSLF